jgi:hypothetical protein
MNPISKLKSWYRGSGNYFKAIRKSMILYLISQLSYLFCSIGIIISIIIMTIEFYVNLADVYIAFVAIIGTISMWSHVFMWLARKYYDG